MKPSEVLDAAAALIEPDGAWGQGASATDQRGMPRSYDDATCRCLFGAVRTVAPGPEFEVAWGYLNLVLPDAPIRWNDARERTQPEVVTKLREAADMARAGGQ